MFRLQTLAKVVVKPLTANFHALKAFKPVQVNMLPTLTIPTLLTQTRSMASKKHKKVLKLAKGFRGRANSCFSVAYHRVLKAQQYAYRDRKMKKRDMRKLWILRLNAASRMYGLPYSRLVNLMLQNNIKLDRKVLSDLAITEPLSFKSVVEVLKASKA